VPGCNDARYTQDPVFACAHSVRLLLQTSEGNEAAADRMFNNCLREATKRSQKVCVCPAERGGEDREAPDGK
jgi:hypothetical protein